MWSKLKGKTTPRIILIYKKYCFRFEYRISNTKLYRAMKNIIRRSKRINVDIFVKKMRQLLTDLDRLHAEKQRWNKRYNSVRKGNKLRAAKREKALLEEQEQKLLKQEQRLLETAGLK